MDKKRGTYHTLNEVGSRIWELVHEGVAVPVIVERLLEEYDVPAAQLEADATALIAELLEARFIAPDSKFEPARLTVGIKTRASRAGMTDPRIHVPSVFRCAFMILLTKLALKTGGLDRTIDWVRRRIEGIPLTSSSSREIVKRAEYAVAMAGAFYPGRARCLEQSLVLYYLLRRQGVALKYCQGVRPYPFQAHAWVEYCGEAINDVPEHALQFARLPEQLP